MLQLRLMKKIIHHLQLSIFCIILAVALGGCFCPHRFTPSPKPRPLPSYYVPEKIRVALVLGSGGVRGMAHVGVLEVLEEAGIEIDLIVGCSAGSIVGAFYAEKASVREIIEPIWEIKTNTVLDFDMWNCRYGLSQGRSMLKVMDKKLNAETFEDLKIPLVVVASDLHSGELVTIGTGDLADAVRASCSIPFFFVPYDYYGRILVDGGVVNPVPVKVARDLGAQVIIAVDLCELLDKTFPTNLVDITIRSSEIAFMWQNEVCTHDADVIIRPKTCDVGTFADDKKRLLYEAGKRAARDQLPHIFEELAKIPQADWDCPKKWRLAKAISYTPAICLCDGDDVEDDHANQ